MISNVHRISKLGEFGRCISSFSTAARRLAAELTRVLLRNSRGNILINAIMNHLATLKIQDFNNVRNRFPVVLSTLSLIDAKRRVLRFKFSHIALQHHFHAATAHFVKRLGHTGDLWTNDLDHLRAIDTHDS